MKNSLLVLGAVAVAASVNAPVANAEGEKEKCYGVVKAGQNDCANLDQSHSCQGQSTKDGDAGEWVYLPKGLCSKLVNGEVK